MIKRVVLVLSLFVSSVAFAQANDPLRNVSGTTSSPAMPWVMSQSGNWTFFHGFDAHVTYLSQTGPEEQEHDVLSTNWLAAGVKGDFGRGFVLARGRVSLEPYTVDENGYAQFFQYVSAENGGPLVDRMRAHDLIGEAAVQVGWRPTESTLLHLYGAVVGQPALGAAPAQLRASGVDFAEAPFAYDIQETFQDSTSVVTAGFATRFLAIEGSVFHDATTTGKHTEVDTGSIDSKSARLTLTPTPRVALQISRGELGEDLAKRTITSGSISYAAPMAAITALWTRREHEDEVLLAPETAYGIELALRGTRNTFMARAEHVDRPAGFPFIEEPVGVRTHAATHFTAGYLFDLVANNRYRAGLGVNVDYRTQTRELEEIYGHKPQGLYAFVRLRSAGL